MTSIARRPTLPAMPIPTGRYDPAPYSPVDKMPCSPLDQLGLAMRRDTLPSLDMDELPVTPTTTTTPIPTLDFKLFRSPSIYSVESGESISFTSSEDEGYSTPYGFGFTSEPESEASEEKVKPQPLEPQTPVEESHVITFSTPSTPRARRVANGAAVTASNNASPADSGAATPTARTRDEQHRASPIGTSASPTQARVPTRLRSAVSEAPFSLRPAPVRTARSASASNPSSPSSPSMPRSASEPVPPVLEPTTAQPVSPRFPETAAAPYCESVHGEQGSDWGEDENDFEWLDAADVPEASTLNTCDGLQGRNAVLSPTRRLSHRLSVSRLRTAIPALGGAAPKADATSTSSASPITEEHPSSIDDNEGAAPAPSRRRTFKKKRSYHIPRRAPPPPPPGAGFVAPLEEVEETRSRSPAQPRTSTSSGSAAGYRNTPSPDLSTSDDSSTALPEVMPPVVVITATPPRQRTRLALGHGMGVKELPRDASLAYSFYDLDATPKNGRTPSDTFPRGRYARVPLHELNGASPQRTPGVPTSAGPPKLAGTPARRTSAGDVTSVTEQRTHAAVPAHVTQRLSRAPTMSEANRMRPDELVNAGIARRDAGDLPKSAWLFMKASEAGNVGGQIHYGVNLRYGLGIARDDRRAFSELSAACERGLAIGDVDLRAAAGTLLAPEQIKSMPPHLSTGLVELGTCYLDGIGCKRQPELALEHLRMAGSLGDLTAQEQLGQLLSKGAHHVKKDMRESAKWYRAAIGNGSSIPGLAWVWKDKYSTD